ncbi:hypothetical protein Belba_0947 [Belliella baltica DSM 15883]|uniref:Uncharacterized protein n=1 Tax=Belliella baltica (strain DSM 15883 / CIP 108006 / LMG 21964 / BA134) TaxID=866536 RepID=I3Z2X2_BELBD|nr:hypothetical protein [Belliella baltica]AFL83590.1 hypothetical protein Belba_0947 [Belliella baltica DSM 15883]
MSFEEKLDSYFSKISIQLKESTGLTGNPAKHLLHIYADYVEVVSVFSNGTYISVTDILDRFKDEGLIHQKEKDSDQAEGNDENQTFVENIFRLILEREQLYGNDYPFLIRDSNKIIVKEIAELTLRNKLYFFLLFSSSLSLFNLFQPELTKEFEFICFKALKNFLPNDSEVRSFGKNTTYSGTAITKIRQLASELNVDIDERALDQISHRGTQERGLDLIGWIRFTDNVPNLLTILAQCACGKEWYQKLRETERYNRYFDFHCSKPIHVMFVPYSIIDYNRSIFYQNDECNDRIIFERKRILDLSKNAEVYNELISGEFIERCINAREDLV